jgi:ribokinase
MQDRFYEIIVLGNACLDRTYHVEALPRPGETLIARQVTTDLGGKGLNQAVAARRAGASVRLIAALGDDETGRRIRDALANEGIPDQHLIVRSGPSDTSTAIVNSTGENIIVSDTKQAASITSEEIESYLGPLLDRARLLLLQGNLERQTTLKAAQLARKASALLAVNPSPEHTWFRELPPVDILIANEAEAQRWAGATPLSVVTRGSAGCVLRRAGAQGVFLAAPVTTAVDSTGAGDVFAGTFFAEWLGTGDPVAAARLAVHAASDKVSRRGTLSAFPAASTIANLRRNVP